MSGSVVVALEMIWDHQHEPVRSMGYHHGLKRVKFFPIYVDPSDDYPAGRKGYCLAKAWEKIAVPAKADGMLIKDADCIIDPYMLEQMMNAIYGDVSMVYTAPVRIWPISTHRLDWVWASWYDKASQELDEYPRWFSFNFTYIPKEVWETALRRGLSKWQYPRVDANVSLAAQVAGVKAHVVKNIFPVHSHF